MKHALFIFYNKARGKQAILSARDKKHVDLIVKLNDKITIFQYSGRGIEHQYSKATDMMLIMKKLLKLENVSHLILVKINKKCRRKNWFPIQLNSCNEVCRKISSVDIGWTFNPSHLYHKILMKRDKSNYSVVENWSK